MFGKPKRSSQDFNDEIQAHLQNEVDRLVEEGMDREQAMTAARRAFGNVTNVREQFYESSRWLWLDRLTRDIRYALRQIRSSPVSTATVIVSLALGIGFNTAIFSLADQALLRALPVEKPAQLVLLDWNGEFVGGGYGGGNLFPYLLYRELRKENDVFADMFARHPTDVHLSMGRVQETAAAEIVSGSYFPMLGVHAALGRVLTDADDLQPGAHPVVVLSYDYWRNRLGADPAIVGKRILVNNFPMAIAGVAEQGFHGIDVGAVPVIWIPIMMKRQATPGWDALFDRRTRWLHIFGRLKPGISAQQAQTRLQPWFKAYLLADTRREGWPQVTDAQMKQYMASRLDVLPAAQGRSDLRRHIREPDAHSSGRDRSDPAAGLPQRRQSFAGESSRPRPHDCLEGRPGRIPAAHPVRATHRKRSARFGWIFGRSPARPSRQPRDPGVPSERNGRRRVDCGP